VDHKHLGDDTALTVRVPAKMLSRKPTTVPLMEADLVAEYARTTGFIREGTGSHGHDDRHGWCRVYRV
jgi:hypothetical protein